MFITDADRELIRANPYSNYYSIAWALTAPTEEVRQKHGLPPLVTTLPFNKKFPTYADVYGYYLSQSTLNTLFKLNSGRPEDRAANQILQQHPLDTYLAEQSQQTLFASIEKTMPEFRACIPALFPTDQQQDPKNPCPISNAYDHQIISNNPDLQKTLVLHFISILRYYGFEATQITGENPSEYSIAVGILSPYDRTSWIYPDSPHYQDIATILKSLCLHGLSNIAQSFMTALQEIYSNVQISFSSFMPPEKTITLWQQAQQVPAPTAVTIAETNTIDPAIEMNWTELVRSLRDYHEKVPTSGPLDGFFGDRKCAKREATLCLLQTLCGRHFDHGEVAHLNPTGENHVENATQINLNEVLKTRVSHAAAIALGYISQDGEAMSGVFSHNMHDKMMEIIEANRFFITGEVPRATPAARA